MGVIREIKEKDKRENKTMSHSMTCKKIRPYLKYYETKYFYIDNSKAVGI